MFATSRRRIGVAVLAILLAALVVVVPTTVVGAAGKPLPAQLAFDVASHEYGSVTVGQAQSSTFTLSNPGGKGATGLSVGVSGTGMSITATTCGKSLKPGVTCDVTVTFAPNAVGAVTGQLTAAARGVTSTTVALSGTAVPVTAPRYLYWSNPDIGRANLDGTSANPAFFVPDGSAWTLEVGGGFTYWAYAESIFRTPVDGTGTQQTVHTTAAEFLGIAVAEPYLYWTNYSAKEIWRANLDGTDAVALITGLDNPSGLDVAGEYLYWSEYSGASTSKIRRVALSAPTSTPELLFEYAAGATAGPGGLEVGNGRVYWSETDWSTTAGSVLSVPIAGGDLVTHVSLAGPNRIDDIALDTEGGWLYYTVNADDNNGDNYDSSIARRPLDGTGDAETIVSGIWMSYNVAIG